MYTQCFYWDGGIPTMLTRTKRHIQFGMSLVELMVALTMGLFLLLGLTTFLSANLRGNADAVKLANLNQELRAIMTLMTRDIRRAGYWGSNGTLTTGALGQLGAGSSVYAASSGVIFATISGVPAAPATSGCILLSYDINKNSVQEDAEKYGFLLNNGAVMMRTGVGASTYDCTAAATNSWDFLSDPKSTFISALTFSETDSAPIYMSGASGSNIKTRQITITITGQPLNGAGSPDTTISQTLTETVKVNNDLFNP